MRWISTGPVCDTSPAPTPLVQPRSLARFSTVADDTPGRNSTFSISTPSMRASGLPSLAVVRGGCARASGAGASLWPNGVWKTEQALNNKLADSSNSDGFIWNFGEWTMNLPNPQAWRRGLTPAWPRRVRSRLALPGRSSRGGSLERQRAHAFGGAEQADVGAAPREQADGDDTDDLVDLLLQRDRIGDRQAGHVDDLAAVVGDEGLVAAGFKAQLGLAAQRRQLAQHGVARHRQHVDQLGAVGDADELFRYRGDNFFARQRRAAALDHRAAGRDFVGAVDVDGDLGDVVEVVHGDAVTGQPRRRRFRGSHSAGDAVLDLGRFVDEEVGRRAGADADDLAVDDVGDGCAGDGLFELVLGQCCAHGGFYLRVVGWRGSRAWTAAR